MTGYNWSSTTIIQLTNQRNNNHTMQNASTNTEVLILTTHSRDTMPTVMHTVALGIPPRLRSPAKQKKRRGKKVHNEKVVKSCKRKVTDIDDESSESEKNSESDSPKEKSRKKKRQRTISLSSDEEMEVVDNAPKPLPAVEEVDDMDVEPIACDSVSNNPRRLMNMTYDTVVGR